MAVQGGILLRPELRQVLDLLSWTALTPTQIAEELSCSRAAILLVNEDYGVREYAKSKPGNDVINQRFLAAD